MQCTSNKLQGTDPFQPTKIAWRARRAIFSIIAFRTKGKAGENGD